MIIGIHDITYANNFIIYAILIKYIFISMNTLIVLLIVYHNTTSMEESHCIP